MENDSLQVKWLCRIVTQQCEYIKWAFKTKVGMSSVTTRRMSLMALAKMMNDNVYHFSNYTMSGSDVELVKEVKKVLRLADDVYEYYGRRLDVE